jgi:hypothetical protein
MRYFDTLMLMASMFLCGARCEPGFYDKAIVAFWIGMYFAGRILFPGLRDGKD